MFHTVPARIHFLLQDAISPLSVFSGYCTCGYDKAIRDWRKNNPHTRSCSGSPCVCGIDHELMRWDEGRWHLQKCGKYPASATALGVSVWLYGCPPGAYSSESMPDDRWHAWIKAYRRRVALDALVKAELADGLYDIVPPMED